MHPSELRKVRAKFAKLLSEPGPIGRGHYDSLRSMLEAHGISEDAATWVIQSCDPTVGRNHVLARPVGVPDPENGSTIVHQDSRTITIVSPFPVDHEWEVSICVFPCANAQFQGFNFSKHLYGYADVQSSVRFGDGSLANPFDMGDPRIRVDSSTADRTDFAPTLLTLCYRDLTSGTEEPLWCPGGEESVVPATIKYETGLTRSELDYNKYVGPGLACRWAGGSLKVYNTTPELVKAGTVTVSRMSREEVPADVRFSVTSPVADSDSTVLLYQLPPGDIAAQRLQGGVTMDGKEGALTVIPCAADKRMKCVQWRNMLGRSQAALYNPSGLDYRYMYVMTYPSIADPLVGGSMMQDWSLEGTVMTFSGLPDKSVLTLCPDFYLEQRVKPDSQLATLASPSTPFCPTAISLVDYVSKTLPLAVPAHENGIGDWFKKVGLGIVHFLDEATPILAPIVSSVAPEAAPLMAGLQATLAAVDASAKRSSRKSAPRKKAAKAPPAALATGKRGRQ